MCGAPVQEEVQIEDISTDADDWVYPQVMAPVRVNQTDAHLFTYDAGDCPSQQTGLVKEKQDCLIHSSDDKVHEQNISGMSGVDQETHLKDISNTYTWLQNHNNICQRKVQIQSQLRITSIMEGKHGYLLHNWRNVLQNDQALLQLH